MQTITSAATSIRQVPALHKYLVKLGFLLPGAVTLDYGGGKYDDATEYLAQNGVRNLVYDPYNRDRVHNWDVQAEAKAGVSVVLLANVLNVIPYEIERRQVLTNAIDYKAPIIISVYEGDGTGVGKQTTKGWQENRKLASYMREIQLLADFQKAVKRGGYLFCWPVKCKENKFSKYFQYV